jgi:uncharacterized protein (TIRG00374 family)
MSKTDSTKDGARKRRSPVHTLAGVVISVALLTLLLWWANLGEVVRVLRAVSPWAVLGTLAILYLSVPLRVVQWRWLLSDPSGVSWWAVLRATCIGYLGNGVLPMRGGELMKAYVLARSGTLSFTRILPSVILTRAQDFLPILAVMVVAFSVIPLEDRYTLSLPAVLDHDLVLEKGALSGALRMLAGIVALMAVALAILYVSHARVRRVVVGTARGFSDKLADRLDGLLAQLSDGIAVVGSPGRFWGAQGISVACWGLFVVAPLPILMDIGLSAGQAMITSLAITGLGTVAHLLPSLPGAVGTFHVFCLGAVLLCNPDMETDTAVAYAVLAQLIGAYGIALSGLLFLPTAWDHLGRKA